jgi:hypothetical protein
MLDAEGEPIAVFPCHLKHAPGEYVGATKSLNVLTPATFVNVTGKRKDASGKPMVRREVGSFDRSKAVFAFTTEPVEVPGEGEIGAYYRKGITTGALLPADKATAEACGIKFVPAAEALEAQRQAAAKEFKRQFGEVPAWALEKQQASVAAQT